MDKITALEILRQLIAFDTVNPPGNERVAAVYLKQLLEEAGFSCEIQELGNNRANLIALLGKNEGPELMLNGHLDVVPAVGDWTKPPFAMTLEDGKIFGRGACDMKGGIAAMCMAAIRAAEKGSVKKGRLKLFFTADEEDANLGTHAYLNRNEKSDYVIIGEPTELEIAVAHRGVERNYIEVHGESRHSALPQNKENAINKTVKVIDALEKVNQEMSEKRHEVLPAPSLAITKLEGYEKDNVVPGTVQILTDCRILPGMTGENVEEILRSHIKEAGLKDVSIKEYFYLPGGEIESGDAFVHLCCRVGERILKKERRPKAFDASCEQCLFQQAGMRAVICGPGSIRQAHTVDEWMELKQLEQAVRFYETVIQDILEEGVFNENEC